MLIQFGNQNAFHHFRNLREMRTYENLFVVSMYFLIREGQIKPGNRFIPFSISIALPAPFNPGTTCSSCGAPILWSYGRVERPRTQLGTGLGLRGRSKECAGQRILQSIRAACWNSCAFQGTCEILGCASRNCLVLTRATTKFVFSREHFPAYLC